MCTIAVTRIPQDELNVNNSSDSTYIAGSRYDEEAQAVETEMKKVQDQITANEEAIRSIKLDSELLKQHVGQLLHQSSSGSPCIQDTKAAEDEKLIAHLQVVIKQDKMTLCS